MVLYRRNRVPGGTYFFTAVWPVNGWRTKQVYRVPHPGNTIKTYTKKNIIEEVKKIGVYKMSYYEYKGYYGSCKVSVEDNCLHGKIEFIDDLVNYEAETAEELKKEFMLAVDDYLEHCKAIGKTPNQTCKGSFNVRIGSELHQKLVLKAEKAGKSLNDYIKSIVEQDVKTA